MEIIGILQRATDAKTNTDNSQIKEKIRLAYSSALTKDIAEQKGEVQKSTFEVELEIEFPNKAISIEDSADKKEWIITIDGVKENVPIGKDTPTTLKVADNKNEKFDINTELEDSFGNKIVVPAGFKITSDSPDSVTDGIVIEDVNAGSETTVGSQFVWIPVGTIYTNVAKTESKTIKLGRYIFVDDDWDETGIPVSLDQDFTNTSGAYYDYKSSYREETTSREGDSGHNATAKNITEFLTKASKGYYVGRYEARTVTKRTNKTDELAQITEKSEDYVYNYVTQLQASNLSRNMYTTNSNFSSDLMNSYSFNTAVVFLQEFGEANYSIKACINNSLEEKGTTQDHPCNIYDMACNCFEWTTETYGFESDYDYPCVSQGGCYRTGNYTCFRGRNLSTSDSYEFGSFRPILYVK